MNHWRPIYYIRPTYLGGESSVTDGAFEGSFFSVAAVVDLESRVTGKRLEADVTRRITTAWNGRQRIQQEEKLLIMPHTKKSISSPYLYFFLIVSLFKIKKCVKCENNKIKANETFLLV